MCEEGKSSQSPSWPEDGKGFLVDVYWPEDKSLSSVNQAFTENQFSVLKFHSSESKCMRFSISYPPVPLEIGILSQWAQTYSICH